MAEKERILSIFVDESGDFGDFSNHSPFYLVSMVLHEQDRNIEPYLNRLDSCIEKLGIENHAIHTGPIIRKESVYGSVDINTRKALFNVLFNFYRSVPANFICINVKKEEIDVDRILLIKSISREIANAITRNIEYFNSFSRIIIYYDNGQVQLTRILTSIFSSLFENVDFRKVRPADYRLFQAADLICTINLIQLKGNLSNSEKTFFGSYRDLKKNYIKPLKKKQL